MSNTGFESDLANWTLFTGTETMTSEAFAESNALALSANRSKMDQHFSVVSGETYTLSVYGKTSADAWSGVGLRFYDDQWNELEGSGTHINTTDWAEYMEANWVELPPVASA